MYANHLKEIRKNLDLSIAKMSKQLEMSASTLTSYERGERTPSVEFLTRLYKVFNVNTNWFVSGEGSLFNNKTINEYENIKEKLLIDVKKMLKKEGVL